MARQSHFSRVDWIPVAERSPEPNQAVLLVTNERVFEVIGKPSLSVDVGYYNPERDSYECVTEQLVSGEVLYWAKLPEVPWLLCLPMLRRNPAAGGKK